MGDLNGDYEPVTPATPMENGDFEEEYYSLHINKIFGEQGNAFVPPDQDYSSFENWTQEKVLQECHLEYVSTFFARVEVFRTANRIPVFSENLLQEIHKVAQKSSQQLLDFIFLCRERANNSIKHQLDVSLEKFHNLIKARNATRQIEILESVKASEKDRFLKCLKQRYPFLFGQQTPPNKHIGKFYEKTHLAVFVNEKRKVCLERFKVLISTMFVRHGQNSKETMVTIQKAAFAETNQWMTQEGSALTQKNEQIEYQVNAELEKVIINLKHFLKEIQKTAKDRYFDDVKKEIQHKLRNTKQKIKEICEYAVVQNYREILNRYQVEADSLCKEYIDTLKVSQIESCFQKITSDFQSSVTAHVEGTKISHDMLGDISRKAAEFFLNHIAALIGTGCKAAENIPDPNIGFQTPGSDIRIATPFSESGCDSDATVLLEHALNSKRVLKRRSIKQERDDENGNKKTKASRDSK